LTQAFLFCNLVVSFFHLLNTNPMAQENRISAAISASDKEAILQHLSGIRQLLAPVLLFNLEAEEKQGLAKMGDKSLAFVEKALDYATKNSQLVPPYLNLPEALKDFGLTSNLKEFAHELGTLSQAVDDTLMVAGSEAYDAALVFHASVKSASRTDAAGSLAIYEDLVQRFPRGGRRIAAPAPSAPQA
jgi:hypothetical protein